jgi:hypothetical protein
MSDQCLIGAGAALLPGRQGVLTQARDVAAEGATGQNAVAHSVPPREQPVIRPEIGYYRSWMVPAFDLGIRKNELMCAFDVTLRF